MNKCFERLYNGIVKENPTLVLMLGMCPTLAVTTSAINGLGMGLTTTAVLAMSNVIISLLRKVIPNKIRIPAFIVIIASFVTILQLLLQAYIPSLYTSLGIYIPLIVVNCIILGRAEAYAYKNPVLPSFFDGLGMGLGFTVSLTLIGLLREFLGGCSVFGYELGWFTPAGIFKMAPGAFFVLAMLTAIQNKVKIAGARKGKDVSKIQSGCGHDCANCDMIQSGLCQNALDGTSVEDTKADTPEDTMSDTIVVETGDSKPDNAQDPKPDKAQDTKTDKAKDVKADKDKEIEQDEFLDIDDLEQMINEDAEHDNSADIELDEAPVEKKNEPKKNGKKKNRKKKGGR